MTDPCIAWSGPTISTLCISLAATLIAGSAAVVSYLLYRSQADPDVIVYAELDRKRPSLLNIIIKNQGRGCAYDVRFAWSGTLPARAWGIQEGTAPMPNLMTEGPLIRGIPLLPPDGTRTISWGQYGGIAKGLNGRTVNIQIEFKSKRRVIRGFRQHETSCPLEIASFEAIDDSDLNWDKKIANNVDKLRQSLESESRALLSKLNSLQDVLSAENRPQGPQRHESDKRG